MALAAVPAHQAEMVEVVVPRQQRLARHGVERRGQIVPDRFAGLGGFLLAGLRGSLASRWGAQGVLRGVEVVDDHLALGGRDTGSLPGPPGRADETPVQGAGHEDATDLGPEFALFVERLDGTHGADFVREAGEAEDAAHNPDREAGAAGLVEAGSAGGEDVGVVEPELGGLGGHVGAEFVDEEVAEGFVLAVGEDLPGVGVVEGGVGGGFKFEEVALARVEVDGVDAAGSVEEHVHDVVSGTGDGEDHVVFLDVQESAVDLGIFL